MLPCLRQLLALKFEFYCRNWNSSDQTMSIQSSVIWFWWEREISVLIWQKWPQCDLLLLQPQFPVLFPLPALLPILILTSDYLSYCCLPIRLKQSGYSPLTSSINKTNIIMIKKYESNNFQYSEFFQLTFFLKGCFCSFDLLSCSFIQNFQDQGCW